MAKVDTIRLGYQPPILAEGEVLPTRPAYWLIWVLEDVSQRPYHSRMTDDKLLTPFEAARQCYGIPPTRNMRFFNLSSSIVRARKRLKEINIKWQKAGGR